MEDHLRAAAITLKLVRSPDSRFLVGFKVMWPDVPMDWWLDYGRAQATYRLRHATAAELGHLDQVLQWMTRWLKPDALPTDLPPDASKILWLRASGFPWSEIIKIRSRGRPMVRGGKAIIPRGNSHVSLRTIYRETLDYLARELAAAGVQARLPA